jgi:hypothetical protein
MRTLRLALPLILLAASPAALADSKACKAGALVFGDPTYTGTDKPNYKGQTVRQDPPLEWRSFALGKGKIFGVSGRVQEVWGGDVAGAIKRIAGENQVGTAKFGDGACGDALFIGIWGIATLRDGTLVVADHGAHAIRLVSDPLGPTCKVTTLVGPTDKFQQGEFKAAKPGDVDGAAKDAKIGGPSWPITDGSGNIYFVDQESAKVKMIGTDAARTVTTLAALKPDTKALAFPGMTMLDDKLYVIANTFTNGLVIEVDPEAKKLRVIKDAPDKGFPPLSANAPSLTSIASDGTSLLLSGQGYIWRLSKDGKAISTLAGTGFGIEFPKKYNPAGVYPVKDLFLRFRNDDSSSGGTSTAMVWNDNALYWRGRDSGGYVIKIGCP